MKLGRADRGDLVAVSHDGDNHLDPPRSLWTGQRAGTVGSLWPWRSGQGLLGSRRARISITW
jgi:hypothetical protein